jgi:hypothetical protein
MNYQINLGKLDKFDSLVLILSKLNSMEKETRNCEGYSALIDKRACFFAATRVHLAGARAILFRVGQNSRSLSRKDRVKCAPCQFKLRYTGLYIDRFTFMYGPVTGLLQGVVKKGKASSPHTFWQWKFVIIILKYVEIIPHSERTYSRAGMDGLGTAHLDVV